MANETLTPDGNTRNIAGAITDDSAQEIRKLRIDDTTKGLKVMIVGGVGAGTVTSVSVVSANGFAGSVATATTTPAITLSTTINAPVLAGNGTAISAATTTGSGSTVVLATSPALTTPNIGIATATSINGLTITSSTGTLTITNGKTLAVTNTLTLAGTDGKGINVGAATSGKILIGDGSNMVLSTPTYPTTAGNSGNVLTSDGTNWQSSTPASTTTPKMMLAWDYSVASRYSPVVSGSGTNTLTGMYGLAQDTVTGATSSAFDSYELDPNNSGGTGPILGSPTVTFYIQPVTMASDVEMFFGMGDMSVLSTNKISFIRKHIGFKIIRTASGAINLSATQGDGSTENASSTLTTVANGDRFDLIFVINGTSSVDYYWRKNGSTLSSATNLTTNLPATLDKYYVQVGITNGNTNVQNIVDIIGGSYSR